MDENSKSLHLEGTWLTFIPLPLKKNCSIAKQKRRQIKNQKQQQTTFQKVKQCKRLLEPVRIMLQHLNSL